MIPYCRLCADEKKDYEFASELSEIKQMLIKCCKWQKSENEHQLPQHVCYACIEKLDHCWEFLNQVETADKILNELLVTPETVKEEVTVFELEPVTDIKESKHEIKDDSDDDDDDFRMDQSDNHSSDDDSDETTKENGSTRKRKRPLPFSRILNADDYLPNGIISENGVKKIEIDFPEKKTITWHNCKYNCNKCDLKIEGSNNFLSHYKSVHHNELKSVKFDCFYCDERESNLRKLNSHIAEEHFIHLKYQCQYCTDIFWDLKVLKYHRSKHIVPDLTCGICGKGSMKRSNFMSHVMSKHKPKETEEKPTCDICKKVFISRVSVKNHIISVHTTVRKYVCDQCGQSFNQKGNMISHLRTVHTDSRPFQCSHCKKGFKTKTHLKGHMRIHAPTKDYCCSLCGKSFHSKSQLTAHSKTHADVGAYTCQFCGKNFKQRTTWLIHERIHTGDMRYRCSVCEYKSNSWGNLNKHTTKQHGIDLRSDRWKKPLDN